MHAAPEAALRRAYAWGSGRLKDAREKSDDARKSLSRRRSRKHVSRCKLIFFLFQAEDGIRDLTVTGVQTCALPISHTRTNDASGLLRRLIPCLDVQDGRVVKGVRFQNLRDAGDPAEQAARYEAQGADEIVILDIVASAAGRATQVETVRAVRAAIRIPLTVGGGVRSGADARQLLSAGADKVSVNTAAVRRPVFLTELAQAFGCQCIVLAIDARRIGGDERWEVLVRGGRDTALHGAIAWAREG